MCLHPKDITNCIIETDSEDNMFLEKCDYSMVPDMKCTMKKGKNIKMLQLNARGLTSKITNLENMLHLMSDKGLVIDIITVCETFFHKGMENMINLKGYAKVCNSRQISKGGGVAIFVRDGIRFNERIELSTFLEKRFETITIELCDKKDPVIISSIYRPPNTSLPNFMDIYTEHVVKLKNACKNVIVSGDFNIDFYDVQLMLMSALS